MELCRLHEQMYVTADGYENFKIPENSTVLCAKGSKKVKIIRIDPPNFYEALRKKASERRERVLHEE